MNYYRDRLRERILTAMGGKCQSCGYDKCQSALECHHIDPKTKEFSIGDNFTRSWENVKNEFRKCVLVCSNCHREIHAKIKSCPAQYFNEDFILEVDQQVAKYKKQDSVCIECGEPVYKTSTLCLKCAGKKRRSRERPSRDELKQLIREVPFLQIGRMYSVSDNSVKKWCISYGLPSKKKDIKSINDNDWELI